MPKKRYYVYTLTDPRNGEVFYVGKGCGARMHQHEKDCRAGRVANPEKHQRIRSILDAGLKVKPIVVEAGLSEADALSKERKLIGRLGFSNLTNIMAGQWSAIERSKCHARAVLASLKPMAQWLSERERTRTEIKLAKLVYAEFAEMAEHGNATEAIISVDGVEFR